MLGEIEKFEPNALLGRGIWTKCQVFPVQYYSILSLNIEVFKGKEFTFALVSLRKNNTNTHSNELEVSQYDARLPGEISIPWVHFPRERASRLGAIVSITSSGKYWNNI